MNNSLLNEVLLLFNLAVNPRLSTHYENNTQFVRSLKTTGQLSPTHTACQVVCCEIKWIDALFFPPTYNWYKEAHVQLKGIMNLCVCARVCVSNQCYRLSLNISTYLRDIDEAQSVLTGVCPWFSSLQIFFVRVRPRSACKLGLHTTPHPHTHIPEHTQEFLDMKTVSDTRIWILHVFCGCGWLVYFCNLGKQWSSVCVLSRAGFLETVTKIIFHP